MPLILNKLISKYFPNIKINLLVANKNYKTLINQIKHFKPRYVYLNDPSKIKFIKEIVIKIFDKRHRKNKQWKRD